MNIILFPSDRGGDLSHDRVAWEKLSVNDFKCLNSQTAAFAEYIVYVQGVYKKVLKNRDGSLDHKYPDPIIGQEVR